MAGREALAALQAFLRPLNAAAATSLAEAGEQLITLHQLNVPATLHVSLLSTNAIKNVMRNYRAQTAKVSHLSRSFNDAWDIPNIAGWIRFQIAGEPARN